MGYVLDCARVHELVPEIASVYTYIFAQCYPACMRPTEVKQLSTVEVYKNGSFTKREQTAVVYSGFPNKHSRRGDTRQRTRDRIKRTKEDLLVRLA